MIIAFGRKIMHKDSDYLRETFNISAKWYDRSRPGYPSALVDDVLNLSSIPASGRILEIGCGTGKATEMFALRGYLIVCLEIGSNLAAVAIKKFQDLNHVQIVVSSFEDWDPNGQCFDLIIAATSFHWVKPSIAYNKSASILRPNGSLAVFTNTHIRQDEGFFLRVQDDYRAFAPSLIGLPRRTNGCSGKPAGLELFELPVERRYQWEAEYTAKEYVDLLGTYSDHISLPEAERRDLLASIAELIDREYDGKVLKHYESVLWLYKRRP